MIKKTIKYKNFLGEEEVGTFWFNLSQGELTKMQLAAVNQQVESFQDKLEKIGKNLQGEALVEVVDEIIMSGYGEKTTDGKGFVKVRNGVKLVEGFMSTGAYDELIVELCTVEGAMQEFIQGLIPSDLQARVKKDVEEQSARQRSEAQLQGYQKKQETPKSTVQVVPEIPTVIENTAEPVLEAAPSGFNEHKSDDLTTEELEALLAARKSQ